MSTSDGQVVADAAEVYEQFFVPALFAEWSPRIAEWTEVGSGDEVLDVACGTGILAREMARIAGASHVSGLDCNPGMLQVAQERAADIRWHSGDALALPFEDASFDVVACQFGLMFFTDRPRALREMWRVLRPGGRMAVAVWGALEATPGYAAMVELLNRLFGAEIADELRAPFCLGDSSKLAALAKDAGLAGAKVSTVVGRARFPSIAEWIHTDVRGWTLADKLDDERFQLLAQEAETALAEFTTPDGSVSFASPANLVLVTKPAT